ncbi:MAG: GNAT family N-acetyltransferase, partial [Bacteroidota bacterium]
EPEGFLILGLDEEDELLALLAVQAGDQSLGRLQQIISMVVRHDARGQGHGKALLKSARMLSRSGLEVPLQTKHPLRQFFLDQNVETVELPLS